MAISKEVYKKIRDLETSKMDKIVGPLPLIQWNAKRKKWWTEVDGEFFAHKKPQKVHSWAAKKLGNDHFYNVQICKKKPLPGLDGDGVPLKCQDLKVHTGKGDDNEPEI